MKIVYFLIFCFWYLLSLLPLRVLYFFSDLLYYPLYYCIRYRRPIVRKNLIGSFPEKDIKEIIKIEKEFYKLFCDYLMETIKLFTMPKKQLMKRMTFDGIEDITDELETKNKELCFVYLGHYGNWEWIASLGYWTPKDILCAQIYHPLSNKAFDALFIKLRSQFGGECIPMKVTLRRIIELKKAQQKTIIGFISDQLPKWSSIHHFTPFLHRDTAMFTGTEQMGKKFGALIYYAEVTRPKRGYYHCTFKKLTEHPESLKNFEVTDLYATQLEQMIKQTPYLWLWSHDRWKRTKEEYERRKKESASNRT